MRAIQKCEASRHICPPKGAGRRFDPSPLNNAHTETKMKLSVTQDKMENFENSINAH
jgi:hypothetical protein